MISISEVNLCCVLVLVCLLKPALGFSYNTYAKMTFLPKNSNNHSYFGYSVLLRMGNKNIPQIVVGAPRDKSYYINHRQIDDPGAMYVCKVDLDQKVTECDQKILDTDGNVHSKENPYYHRKDNMWLGMSLDGMMHESDTTVICAPRWINQKYSNMYFMNGICYTIQNLTQPSSPYMLMPLIDVNKQGFTYERREDITAYGMHTYLNAFGQAGFSAKLSDDGSELLLGSPGVYAWAGSVVRYTIAKEAYNRDKILDKKAPNTHYTPSIQMGSYFGYSVGIGNFIKDKENLYVAGAPRGSEMKGEVILFDIPSDDDKPLTVYAKLEGKQMGEYFGSTIATVDINQDGLTDLVIGSPMYAEKYTKDLGRIYVYINSDKGNFEEQDALLCGGVMDGARFGTSITAIGDINNDGFIDIAIGAPYENYGMGAVYIYLGAENGVNIVYSQRISFSDTLGFGISISKGLDIDNNSCNDIVIGAHSSARVFLLRCHPSVRVFPQLETIPAQISTNDTSFAVQVCMKFERARYKTDLEIALTVDDEFKRVKINDSENPTIVISGNDGEHICKEILYDIKSKDMDYSRPVEVVMTYKLKRNPLLEKEFCRECTVLEPSANNLNQKLSITVPFGVGCGADFICHPDLKLNIHSLSGSELIVGSSTLNLNITVDNFGEPAFLTKVQLTIPVHTPLQRIPPECYIEENDLICDFGTTLKTNETKFLSIELDTSQLRNNEKILVFNASATSGGEELNPEDNVFTLKLPLKVVSELSVTSNSGDNQYLFIDSNNLLHKNPVIVHSYEVNNNGPSKLDDFVMRFFVPVIWHDSTTQTNHTLINVYMPTVILNHKFLVCQPLTGLFYEDISKGFDDKFPGDNETVVTDEPTTQSMEFKLDERSKKYIEVNSLASNLPTDNENKILMNSININCSDVTSITCMIIECNGIDLLPGNNPAQIAIQMSLNVTVFELISKNEISIALSTYSTVESEYTLNNGITKWAKSFLIGSKLPSPPTPLWIYLVSLTIGFLVLFLIVFGLYNFGFFRRKSKEELELLKNAQNHGSEENL